MAKRKTTRVKKDPQTEHLKFLEAWADNQPKLNGVPIVTAVTYDLIQHLNREAVK